MDFWSILLFSLLLLLAAAGLMLSHVHTWRRVEKQGDAVEPREREYRWRQFRRRMQSTTMLALVALALAVGNWITLDRVDAVVFSVYWVCVVLVVLWVALLAIADMVSTRHHFGRIQQSQLKERARLEAELEKIRAAGDEPPADADAESGRP